MPKQGKKAIERRFYALLLSGSLIMIYASMMTAFAFLHTAAAKKYDVGRRYIASDEKNEAFYTPMFSVMHFEKSGSSGTEIKSKTEEPIGSAASEKSNIKAEETESFSDAAAVYAEAVNTPDIPDKALMTDGCGMISLYDVSSGEIYEYSLEEYVIGTLLAEMPTSYSPEALKAQAIACRTYAVYKLMHSSSQLQQSHGGAQLCTSSAHCQAFTAKSSVSEERCAIAKKAVDDTSGIIMYYDGAPILAAFHSSSSKKTKSSADVWGGKLAYLSAVETWESDNPDMDISKKYKFSSSVFSSKIRGLNSGLAACDDNEILSSFAEIVSADGKTESVKVCGENLSCCSVADALGLRSSDFSVSVGDGEVTVISKGYGHGVGMSQYGAEDMAQKGFDCFEILAHYYTGISFGYAG